ncbi:hypothetical protein [Mucilaginibacter sp.]|uniref:hypothetical protein n=1 Tax=Mucilaginibacter sp. TaxID=1882438 RepID=UPI00283AC947|nr:hypothetical protein [Mucilaginibacter sp.]MDR3694660.1 hypothetical protein [Mucilaginibacter sp.]
MKLNTPIIFLLIVFICGLSLFSACGSGNNNAQLQVQVDSLNKKLAQTYRPGLGEFMMGIQIHHAKIWYAGKNQNWALANFEVGEIRETLEDVKQYCYDRPEVKSLPIIYPALDSLDKAIKAKSPQAFEKGFILLTNSCNECHQTTNHQFNVIKTPETPPFTNQEFKVK